VHGVEQGNDVSVFGNDESLEVNGPAKTNEEGGSVQILFSSFHEQMKKGRRESFFYVFGWPSLAVEASASARMAKSAAGCP
jgi:hypothetical protein